MPHGLGGLKPTTSDANLLIGRLSLNNFDMNVNMSEVERVIKEKIANNYVMTAEEGAIEIISIANADM